MPSQHRYPATTLRLDPELRTRAQAAAAQLDSTLTAHVTTFLRWLVGDIDDLPPRPGAKTGQND